MKHDQTPLNRVSRRENFDHQTCLIGVWLSNISRLERPLASRACLILKLDTGFCWERIVIEIKQLHINLYLLEKIL